LYITHLKTAINGIGRDYIWSVAFAPKSHILATSDNDESHILATSDNDGFITIWDLDKCPVINTNRQNEEPIKLKCEWRDRWNAAKGPVRSLAFALDGSYLVQPGRSKPAATKGVITGVNLE